MQAHPLRERKKYRSPANLTRSQASRHLASLYKRIELMGVISLPFWQVACNVLRNTNQMVRKTVRGVGPTSSWRFALL